MKKAFYLLVNLLLISQLTTAQSVTLATTIPAIPTKGTVVYNNGTNQLQYWNGTAWIPITNAASGTGWALNGNDINNNNAGNVGIGTTTPKATFNVADGKTVIFGADSSETGSKLIWYPSKYAFRAGYAYLNSWDYANVGFASTAMGSSTKASGYGSTAIGDNTIASGTRSTAIGAFTTASGSNSMAMGIGTVANGFGSTTMGSSTIANADLSTAMGTYNIDVPNALLMIGNGNFNIHSNALTVMNDGRTGINTSNPLATLHVEGSSYFNGNVGIGTTTPSGKLQVIGNTYLMGNVGIGTTTPLAPLHVVGNNILSSGSSAAYWFGAIYNTGTIITSITNGSWAVGLLVDYDIVGKRSIVSAQTATTSDTRIKNIIGLSNNQDDLAKVRQIQITDYRYKDVHTWGNQTFKKVIAQQVEDVYPQAVRKMTSMIPDIYSLAEKVFFDNANKKLTVSLSKNYDIKIGEKIEFVHETQGKIQAIVESVSGNNFTVKDWQFPTDKIFVYGREVNDFRTVDYEAISMLGISAIQQLAKENEALKSKFTTENDLLKKQISDLTSRFEHLEAMMTKEIKTIEKLNN